MAALAVVATLGCKTATVSAPGPNAGPNAAAQASSLAGAPQAIPTSLAFVSLEGPFWVAAGGYLVFSDVVEQNGPAARIYKYDPPPASSPEPGTFSVVPYPMTPTSTNGLGFDAQGRLLACERWNGALSAVKGNQRTVLAGQAPTGEPLNAPNDLTIRSDGNIYFSDTTWGAKPGPHAPTAVYRIAPDGKLSVAFRVDMPNGVVLSPDGGTLYVGSDAQDRLWRLPVAADGSVGAAAPFVDPHSVPDGKLHVPDGLCVDDSGRVYVTNNSAEVSAIEVFERDGRFAGRIPFPTPPSNCTFGGADRRTLYVTTQHAIYEVPMATAGLP